MSEGAGITNLEAIERFRAALLEFVHDGSNALGEADSEVESEGEPKAEPAPAAPGNETSSAQ